jgi:hypothetical protein
MDAVNGLVAGQLPLANLTPHRVGDISETKVFKFLSQ